MLDLLNIEEIKPLGEKVIDLLIESYSNSARIVQIRGLTKNEIISGDHTTNGDRSLATQTFRITDIPISLAIRPASAGVKRGECYVRVSLRIEEAIIAVLCAGYVTDSGALVYPNGKIESSTEGPGLIRSITGTDPAAGVEISETVPVGAKWKLIGFKYIFSTDATVASRYVALKINDGINDMLAIGAGQAQTASQIVSYSHAVSLPIFSGAFAQYISPLGQNLFLKANWKIKIIAISITAGDNFAAPQLLVEEWIEP